jgi:hypothetical protein
MVRVIARFVDVLVLLGCKGVVRCVPDLVVETTTEKVVFPASPLSQVHLHPVALLGRGHPLAPDTHRVAALRVCFHNLLDPNVVLPVFVEIILVHKPLVQTEAKISSCAPLWVIGEAHATVVGGAVFLPVDDKPMEMAVRPPHGRLKDMMKIGEGRLSVDEETTPY